LAHWQGSTWSRSFHDKSGSPAQCHHEGESDSLNQPEVATSQPSSGMAPNEKGAEACLDAYQRHLAYVLRTLRRLSISPVDLEDLSHEVFLVLWRTWEQYDPTRDLKPYLFGIIFRLAATHRRKFWREISKPIGEQPDSAPRADRALESEQDRAVVLEALNFVPLKRRAVLVMHDIDEIPMPSVAATLSIPLFTAYSRLRKARLEMEAAVLEIRKTRRRSGSL